LARRRFAARVMTTRHVGEEKKAKPGPARRAPAQKWRRLRRLPARGSKEIDGTK